MNISPSRITPADLILADWEECSYSTKTKLKNFELLKTNLNVAPLCEAIEKQPELWNEITARQTTAGSPHRYTKSIFIRWAKGQTVEAAFTEIEAINYPALNSLQEVQELIGEVLEKVEATHLGRVLIVSLEPGGYIEPHCDEGAYADHYERFHVSLSSDEGNIFCTETDSRMGEYVHMQPGELWYFNHKAKHTLFNGSKNPRLHLIIDCVAPKYRRERTA